MSEIPFRFPTSAEWDRLCGVCKDKDDVIHWKDIYTWCEDTGVIQDKAARVLRGYYSARDYYCTSASSRLVYCGFRPVFGALPSGALALEDGEMVTVGTLYTNETPVKVPKDPRMGGDILKHKVGAILEFRESLDDPKYQVRAIKAGNVLIADRCLLNRISWDDIADNM